MEVSVRVGGESVAPSQKKTIVPAGHRKAPSRRKLEQSAT